MKIPSLRLSFIKPKPVYQTVVKQIRYRPLTSFIISLALLLGLIVISNTLLKAKVEEIKPESQVKTVQTFKIGSVPKVTVVGQVEKSGVIKIMALTPGIISKINVTEGQAVKKGSNLINIGSGYSGSNPAIIQASIASKQYDLQKDTFDTQKALITQQRELANKNKDNADVMKDLANKSLDETRSLGDLNQQILDSIDQNIKNLEASPSAGTADSLLQARQLKAQLQAAQNQVRSGQRNLELQAASDKPPADIVNIQRDIALKQLDVQQKSLEVGLEISKLQVSLAAISAESFHPTAPFAGVVDRVFIKEGQLVNPGTPLLQLSGNDQTQTAIFKVPSNIAKNLANFEMSTVIIDDISYQLTPKFTSTQATDGNLYSVIFDLSDTNANLTDSEFITAKLPVGLPDSSSVIPFIPLDSVFQTQTESLVNVLEADQVSSRKVSLGKVVGEYVEITSGLKDGDQVILNRSVIVGDKVQVN